MVVAHKTLKKMPNPYCVLKNINYDYSMGNLVKPFEF